MNKNTKNNYIFGTAFIVLIAIILWLCVLLFFCGEAKAETSIGVSGYYHHWSQSGRTYFYSEVDDKEWNNFGIQLGVTHWFDWFGIYGYFAIDEHIKEEMFDNFYYEADIKRWGLGVKGRYFFKDNLFGYIGVGANYTIFDHKDTIYNNKSCYKNVLLERHEKMAEIGPDVLLGFQHNFTDNFYWSLGARYTWCTLRSEIYNQTHFKPGGTILLGTIGFNF